MIILSFLLRAVAEEVLCVAVSVCVCVWLGGFLCEWFHGARTNAIFLCIQSGEIALQMDVNEGRIDSLWKALLGAYL